MTKRNPDVVLLPAVRAGPGDIPVGAFDGYHLAYNEGDQRGRSGLAVLRRVEPDA